MNIEIGIGQGTQTLTVPDKNLLQVLGPNQVAYDLKGEAEVKRALEAPIGTPALKDIVHPGEKIIIITSDISRPMPTHVVMPALLDALYAAGCKKEDITLMFALGSHRPQTEEEKRKLAGDRAYEEIRCIDSDPDDCVHLGSTPHGTPIDISRAVVEADRRICLGNIEYHYFAGYSGGIKAVFPGCSTREAIQANHSMMVEDAACAGNLDHNPVRDDLEEMTKYLKVDFILNVVLDEHKQIVKAVAGDIVKAHREGCKFLDTMYRVEIPSRAEIVVVSQGGAPKDLNLYQTQKALDNAKHAIADDGVIVLAGSCKEGLGEKTFETWLTEAKAPDDLIERVRKDFKLGGHKAAAIAMVLKRAKIFLVSDMEDGFVRTLFMEPYPSVQAAFDAALAEKGEDARVIVMPYGGSTLPRVKE
ncbi:MAG: nickel-dependent lactate racemase [Lachnospiraceae bacterium]|nr:nickel-dependent lactate racemase [Lachnospiraceae bacterium]